VRGEIAATNRALTQVSYAMPGTMLAGIATILTQA
jgi:hypothetical protein